MASKPTDVLVVGELNVDLILDRLDAFPEFGKEVLARRMLLTLGSSSAIFASNLSVLGSRVSFCGRVGNDSFAGKIITDLSAKGVATGHIIHSDTADTGITVALNAANDRAMVTYPGAMEELTASDVTDEMLDNARHLHISSVFLQPGLRPGLIDLFRRARQKGLTTSLDPQWDPAGKWDLDMKVLLQSVDLFLPNLEELKHLVRRPSLEECLSEIGDASGIVVVKNGLEGAMLRQGNTLLRQPAFLNEEVADAIGAGDSFNAGFIHRFIQGSSLEACLISGALCGAINTTRNGGTTAFTDHDAVQRLAMEKFNTRL